MAQQSVQRKRSRNMVDEEVLAGAPAKRRRLLPPPPPPPPIMAMAAAMKKVATEAGEDDGQSNPSQERKAVVSKAHVPSSTKRCHVSQRESCSCCYVQPDLRRSRRRRYDDDVSSTMMFNDEESRPDWSGFIHEGLVRIFSFLPVKDRFRAGAVCKNWRAASLDPGCWTEAILDYDDEIPTATAAARLDRDSSSKCLAPLLQAVIQRSKGRLRKLSMTDCDLTFLDSITLGGCPLLEELRFARTFLCPDTLSLSGLPRLRSLDLRNTIAFRDFDWHEHLEDVGEVGDEVGQVAGEVGHVDGVGEVGDGAGGGGGGGGGGHGREVGRRRKIVYRRRDLVQAVVEDCPNLVSLLLDGVIMGVSDADMRVIMEGLPNLERLGMAGGIVSDYSLEILEQNPKYLAQLRLLCLDNCTQITKEGVERLQAARKHLQISAKNIASCGYNHNIRSVCNSRGARRDRRRKERRRERRRRRTRTV
ncbi:hypothetical protein CBR_g29618 [Chara braunii]|uniref:F-box domain-containing protein n=1 Tax=Chara braunii TaxID=69332 RepID=A0A388LBB1_CHABU|nr:hypothetical protein CBR_g29618 [Chara braunii]|eukprot:GBG79472.1 hypothetical protein CBR_g29618 [Chara braunii]